VELQRQKRRQQQIDNTYRDQASLATPDIERSRAMTESLKATAERATTLMREHLAGNFLQVNLAGSFFRQERSTSGGRE
jgi:hypothetical protein